METDHSIHPEIFHRNALKKSRFLNNQFGYNLESERPALTLFKMLSRSLVVTSNMISIRLANENDVAALCRLDLIARRENQRREFIRRSVASRACFVAVAGDEVIGYGVLNYTFYDNGCIDMLYVHSDYRRRGAGAALLQHLESLCETSKLFISTNLSNLAMQSLLAKLEYVLSGIIHNLDEGDPEIVYFKRLSPDARASKLI